LGENYDALAGIGVVKTAQEIASRDASGVDLGAVGKVKKVNLVRNVARKAPQHVWIVAKAGAGFRQRRLGPRNRVALVFCQEIAVLTGTVSSRAEFVLKFVQAPPFGISSIPTLQQPESLAMWQQKTAN
jgi:hypothetical protein